jgi:membrane protease YdiL (CAAX protease family)
MADLRTSLGAPIGNAPRSATAGAIAIHWWEPLLVPFISFLVWIFLLVVATIVGALIAGRLGYTPAYVQHFVTVELQKPFFFQLLLAGLYFAFLIVVGFLMRRHGATLVANYANEISSNQIQWAAAIGFAFGVGVIFLLGYLASHHIVEIHSTPADRAIIPHSLGQLLMTLPLVALLIPFVEEMYFRGLLLSWLQQTLPAILAALVSAAIFALVHLHFITRPGREGWVLTGIITVLGLVNATWAQLSRSLWPPLTVHATYNGTLVLAAFLS